MVVWDTHLPNGCVGRQAFPMEAEGRLADFGTAIYPRQSARRFVSFITQGSVLLARWQICARISSGIRSRDSIVQPAYPPGVVVTAAGLSA